MKTIERTPLFHTVAFTTAERHKIEVVAKACGWAIGESALFARHVLMTNVQAILHSEQLRRRRVTLSHHAS